MIEAYGIELRESRVLDSHLVLYTIGLFSLSGFILLYTIIFFSPGVTQNIFFRCYYYVNKVLPPCAF